MLEHLMTRFFDRRIELDRSGQIQYVVVSYIFRFIWIPSSQLHVCNTYLNLLITLFISDNGKKTQVLTGTIFAGYSQ